VEVEFVQNLATTRFATVSALTAAEIKRPGSILAIASPNEASRMIRFELFPAQLQITFDDAYLAKPTSLLWAPFGDVITGPRNRPFA
jgi:hypothetical protein